MNNISSCCVVFRDVDTSSESVSKVVLCIYDDFSQDGLEINTILIEKIEEENKLVPRLPEVRSLPYNTVRSIIIKEQSSLLDFSNHSLKIISLNSLKFEK